MLPNYHANCAPALARVRQDWRVVGRTKEWGGGSSEATSEAMSEATSENDGRLVAHRVASDAAMAALVQPMMIREARLSSEDDRHMVCFLSTQAAVL